MGANAGLLMDRYLQVPIKDEDKDHPTARRVLFEAMCKSLAQSKEIYTAAFERREAFFKDLKSKGLFETAGRLVIGLGGENVLETGLTLNHTYGTPMIPGTALKGLAAHYCEQAWGAADERFKLGAEYHKVIFGTTEDSGHIIFHDAWIAPMSLEGSLQPDVMTPHHGDYYSDEKGLTPPTDFDDPNPVTFLSVVGSFLIAISCDVPGPIGDEWAERIFELLSDALREWGIGGKTNAGYGRLRLQNFPENRKLSEDSSISPLDSGNQNRKATSQIVIKKQKYKKGDIIEVTRVSDPKEKRGAAYFMADDGIGGLVISGNPPAIEIGQMTKLEINGVMVEGYYVFAFPGSKKESQRPKRDRR